MNKRNSRRPGSFFSKDLVWAGFFILFCVILALAVRRYSGVQESVEKLSIDLRGVVWRRTAKIRAGEEGADKSLRREIDVLKNKTAQLAKENEALRKQLEAPLPAELEFLPAAVIGRSRYLYIDKGRAEGVREKDAVLAEEVFVGQVVETGEHTAKIKTPFDAESKIPAVTDKGVLGLVVNDKEKKLILSKVLQREDLKEEDLVSTSGDKSIPRGLLIGKVSGLLEDEKEVYKKAEVVPSVDYNSLLYVFVVKQ